MEIDKGDYPVEPGYLKNVLVRYPGGGLESRNVFYGFNLFDDNGIFHFLFDEEGPNTIRTEAAMLNYLNGVYGDCVADLYDLGSRDDLEDMVGVVNAGLIRHLEDTINALPEASVNYYGSGLRLKCDECGGYEDGASEFHLEDKSGSIEGVDLYESCYCASCHRQAKCADCGDFVGVDNLYPCDDDRMRCDSCHSEYQAQLEQEDRAPLDKLISALEVADAWRISDALGAIEEFTALDVSMVRQYLDKNLAWLELFSRCPYWSIDEELQAVELAKASPEGSHVYQTAMDVKRYIVRREKELEDAHG